MRNPSVPAKVTPQSVDAVLDSFAAAIHDQLDWLDLAYGKIEVRYDQEGKSYPAVFVGGNDYLGLLPDQHLGNYLFIKVAKEDIAPYPDRYISDLEIEITFYFDYREVYEDDQNRTIEHIKNDIYKGITRSITPSNKAHITGFLENGIYKEYSKKIDTTALMRPYGSLKVMCNLKATTACQ